jgi:pimeloyl-ACP methyl ester carboxylesterase
MKKPLLVKILKRTIISILILFILLIIALFIYSRNSYQSLDEMDDNISLLDLTSITIHEDIDEIRYTTTNPIKQIVFIPGGLVEPASYKYLASRLALEGYNVTIVKPIFNLAILTPNYASKFLSKELDNVVIGHSLGGIVGSLVSSGNNLVNEIVFLGSYPIKDLTDKDVMIITAENDLGMDEESFNNSLKYVKSETIIYNINGGNHAQFGWYGPQKGDGEAEIFTLIQQDIVVLEILGFIS